MSERRRTAFAEILRKEDEPETPKIHEPQIARAEFSVDRPVLTEKGIGPLKRNKATSSDYTKLTAYIPRTLSSAIKMSMALDQTVDQSDYIERALIEWLRLKGREPLLTQAGYKTSGF